MSIFYRLYEDGRICDFCEFGENEKVPNFVLEQYTRTDRKIIKLVDDSFAFEDEVDLKTEAKRKTEKEFNELKTAKLAEFKFKRDTIEIEPIEYNGQFYDYDEKARDRINAAIIALDLAGGSLSWTTADQKEAIVTANDLRGIIANVALRSNALHVKYRELKELVEKATTKEELEKITWDEEVVDGK